MNIKIQPRVLKGIVDPPPNISQSISTINLAVDSKRASVIDKVPICEEVMNTVDDQHIPGQNILVLKSKKDPCLCSIEIKGNEPVIHAEIETDIYTAASYLCCSALGCDLTIRGINLQSSQSEIIFLNIMKNMGISFERKLYGLQLSWNYKQGITIDASNYDKFIPFIGVLASFTHGITCITHSENTDNNQRNIISATEKMLSSLGADVVVTSDSLMIKGKNRLYGGLVNTQGNPGIVLATAAAACRCENEVIISHSNCVYEIYPRFWKDYELMGGKITY